MEPTKNEKLAQRLFQNFDILDKHTDPWGIVHLWVMLTKELAWYLRGIMRENRPITASHRTKIYRDIKHGHFQYLAEPMQIDATGQVFNFQHRLEAFLKVCDEDPGQTLPIQISVGFEFRGYQGLDKTNPRSRASDMKMRHVLNSHVLNIAVAYIISYLETKDFHTATSKTVTSAEDQEFLDQHPELISYALQAVQKGVIMSSSWLIALRYIFGLYDPEAAKTLIDQIIEQRRLDLGMPAYAFKQWAAKHLQPRKRNLAQWQNRIAAYTLSEMFIKLRNGEIVKRCNTAKQMPDLGPLHRGD
jgi:hypothetical protein